MDNTTIAALSALGNLIFIILLIVLDAIFPFDIIYDMDWYIGRLVPEYDETRNANSRRLYSMVRTTLINLGFLYYDHCSRDGY